MGQPTDSYGAAPASCYATQPPSCATPPVHTATTYDTDTSGNATHGLAATFWSDLGLSGLPARHATVVPDGSGALATAATDPPAEGLVAGGWSGRYTGEVSLTSIATYTFSLTVAGSGRLYVDDALVVDAWATHPPVVTGAFTNAKVGLHRLRVDYAPPPGGTAQLALSWTPAGAGPAVDLSPRYGNATKTVTDDNAGVPARATATDADGPTGLVKATTDDPGGQALTTSVSYEDVGDGRFRRPLFRTLPAGNPSDPAHATSTAYSYYAGVTHPSGQTVAAETGEPNPCAANSTSVNQGGAAHITTAPAPDSTTPAIVTRVVYDAAGRVVASRTNNDAWSCTTYDPRGRVATVAIPGLSDPAFGPAAAASRTVTHSYGVAPSVGAAPNPLVTSVADASGTITTTVDLLGRVTSTNDAYGNPTAPANATVDHPTRLTYDQAGRAVTSDGPGGRLDTDYAGGQVMRQHVADPGSLGAGPVLAVPGYDASSGELTGVSYCSAAQTTGACATGGPNAGNGTALAIGRDPNGRTTHLGWTGPSGGIVDDVVTRSQSAKVVDESVDGVDANAGANNFVYDSVGRLTEAWVPAHHLTYAFAPTGGCGPMANAGKNSDRTATTDNGGASTTYCYDNADRLVSSTDAANVGSPVYDPHGNATRMGTQTLGYDSSRRHVRTDAAIPLAFSVTYTRDAANRLMARTEGTATTHYGFAASGDSPAFAMGADNVVTQRFMGLAGGAMVTKQASGDVWSYPNVHGDVVATANAAGAKQGTTVSYDPFGQSVGVPDNAPSNLDYGWLGQPQRPTEHAGASTLVEMGARPYSPAAGRFLQRDPVEGGSANDYDYTNGDPVNGSDLNGLFCIIHNSHGGCRGAGVAKAVAHAIAAPAVVVYDYMNARDAERQAEQSAKAGHLVPSTNPLAEGAAVVAEHKAGIAKGGAILAGGASLTVIGPAAAVLATASIGLDLISAANSQCPGRTLVQSAAAGGIGAVTGGISLAVTTEAVAAAPWIQSSASRLGFLSTLLPGTCR